MRYLRRGSNPTDRDTEKAALDGYLSARKARYRLSYFLSTPTSWSIARRLRNVLFMLLALCLYAWVSRSGDFADQRSAATDDHNIDAAATETSSIPQEVPGRLSAGQIPLDKSKPTRAQILRTDRQYLDPEHLVLPRMLDPYPDIVKWPMSKKESHLRGLDWLIAHASDRWDSEPYWRGPRTLSQAVFKRLRECLKLSMLESRPDCAAPEEMTVILLGSFRFGAVHTGAVSGENIWARSVMDAFRELGYSMIYAFENAEIYEIHRAIPDLVQIVIAETEDIRACQEFGRADLSRVLAQADVEQGALVTHVEVENHSGYPARNYTLAEWTEIPDRQHKHTFYGHPSLRGQRSSNALDALDPNSPNFEPHEEWRCAQAPDFPQGIPLWKMFGFHFWPSTHLHPLGPQWTMSPEPYATFPGLSWRKEFNMYTGYSIEAYCGDVVPVEERKHRAYVLAKKPEYFVEDTFALTSCIFEDMRKDSGVDFVVGIGKVDSALPIPGLTNIGSQSKQGFLHEVGQSKALVGIGRPWISPTPYDALCMGVPFVNPIMRWDAADPNDVSKWNPQHEGLSDFGEPWVYNVKKGNETEIKEAIAKAMVTPIDPFVPRRMTRAAMKARHRLLVEADWKTVYEERFGETAFYA